MAHSTIWKFPLELKDGPQLVHVPKGANYLDAQMQDGKPTVWAAVDPEQGTQTVRFHVVGTGQGFHLPHAFHIGTMQHGPYVWHVFGSYV